MRHFGAAFAGLMVAWLVAGGASRQAGAQVGDPPQLESLRFKSTPASPGINAEAEFRFVGGDIQGVGRVVALTSSREVDLPAPQANVVREGDVTTVTVPILVPLGSGPGLLRPVLIEVGGPAGGYRFVSRVWEPAADPCVVGTLPPAIQGVRWCASDVLESHPGVPVVDGSGRLEEFPDIESFDFAPAAVAAGDTVTVTMVASGIDRVEEVLLVEKGVTFQPASARIPGTWTREGNTWTGTITIPAATMSKAYEVAVVHVRNAVGGLYQLILQSTTVQVDPNRPNEGRTLTYPVCTGARFVGRVCHEPALIPVSLTVGSPRPNPSLPEVISFSATPRFALPGQAVRIEVVTRNAIAAEIPGWMYGQLASPQPLEPGDWSFDGTTLRGTVFPTTPGPHLVWWVKLTAPNGSTLVTYPPGPTSVRCPALRDHGAVVGQGCAWDPAIVGDGRFFLQPVIALLASPVGFSEDTTPTFDWEHAPAGATVTRCRVDGGEWSACAAPFTTPALAAGAHTFEVEVRWLGIGEPLAIGRIERAFVVGTTVASAVVPHMAVE